MKRGELLVYWKGHVVGTLEELGVDNFHLYGPWRPAEGPVYQEFAAAVARWRVTQTLKM